MRYLWIIPLIVVAAWIIIPGDALRAQARSDGASHAATGKAEMDFDKMRSVANTMAGYPQIDTDVEMGLAQNAQFSVPAPFKNPSAQTKVTSFEGRLIAFDAHWVGLESPGSKAKLWVPRENVAYVITEPAKDTTRPAKE